MDKKFTNGAKRIFAAMLAVTLLTGTMPGMPYEADRSLGKSSACSTEC